MASKAKQKLFDEIRKLKKSHEKLSNRVKSIEEQKTLAVLGLLGVVSAGFFSTYLSLQDQEASAQSLLILAGAFLMILFFIVRLFR